MTLLTAAPPILARGAILEVARLREIHTAPEGIYAELPAILPGQQVLIQGSMSATVPVALVVPLDKLFEHRIDAARRLWRALGRGIKVKSPTLGVQRRRRLKLVLRALDADQAGVGYRDIAIAMFADRVPRDAAWRTHSLRSYTIRLVQDGRGLMRGGYLKLIRPSRRRRGT